jgi:pimeloyl-ACP methyl ester carboxylesterase
MALRRLKFFGVLIALVLVLGGGTYRLAPQWLMHVAQWHQASEADLSTRQVQIGDTRWTYYEGGKGPVIVLVHGFGTDRSVWLPVAKILTRNFHVVIPDLPGWGQSTRLADADYGIDAQAKRLNAFVHTLNLAPVLVVGHSMGGAIAAGDHAVWPAAAEHMTRIGRMYLTLPLYATFARTPQGLAYAQKVYAKARPGYHPLTQHAVERILARAGKKP